MASSQFALFGSLFRAQESDTSCGLATLRYCSRCLTGRDFAEASLALPHVAIDEGLTLDQWATNAVNKDENLVVVCVEHSPSQDRFREALRRVLAGTEAIAVVNFHWGSLYGDKEDFGHFAAIGDYRAASDEVFVMDPWYEKLPGFSWQSLTQMVKAMDTIDPDCNLKRGFVVVSRNKDLNV